MPGSSGSMVINESCEVIGIYWGTYKYINKENSSVIDLFVNSNISHPQKPNIIQYNVIDDILQKIPSINIHTSKNL